MRNSRTEKQNAILLMIGVVLIIVGSIVAKPQIKEFLGIDLKKPNKSDTRYRE